MLKGSGWLLLPDVMVESSNTHEGGFIIVTPETADLMGLVLSASHYQADVIYLLGIKKVARAKLGLHQLGYRSTFYVSRWAVQPFFLDKTCDDLEPCCILE